jgi:hypothetical protein
MAAKTIEATDEPLEHINYFVEDTLQIGLENTIVVGIINWCYKHSIDSFHNIVGFRNT